MTPLRAASAAAPGGTVEQRMVARLSRERKLKDLERQIEDIEGQISRRNAQMETELQRLRAAKSLARNNLAGATWEQSLSTEMQAVVARTTAHNDADQARLSQLRSELKQMREQGP